MIYTRCSYDCDSYCPRYTEPEKCCSYKPFEDVKLMSNSMYDLDTFIDDEAPVTSTRKTITTKRCLTEAKDCLDFGGPGCCKGILGKINPEHYTDLEIEPWDYIIKNKLGYLEGNIVKYVSRYKKKGGREDLLKARTYLDKLIDLTV